MSRVADQDTLPAETGRIEPDRAQLELIAVEVLSEYQTKGGRYDVYLKGLFNLALFYIRWKLKRSSH